MVHKYYLSTLMKAILIAYLVMLSLPLLLVLLLLVISMIAAQKAILVLFALTVYFGSMVAIVIWRLRTPAVEISEAGFKVSIPFLYKKNSAAWDEVEGMTFGKIRTFGIPDKQLKILLKSEGAATKEIILSLKAVAKPDEIIAKLRERIREITYEDLRQSSVLQQPVTKAEVKYGKWTFSERGIADSRKTVAWSEVTALSYSGLVIAGYGATTITHRTPEGKEKGIIIKPKASAEYHEVLRFLIQHATKAAIDPGLVKALEYAPKDARADMHAVLLLLLAVVLWVMLPMFIGSYALSDGSQAIFSLMPTVLGLLPMAMTVKLLAGRFRGKAEPAEKKLLWAGLSGAVLAATVFVFFILSPFSFYYFIGDLGMKTGNLLQANYWYGRALEEAPDDNGVIFDMGVLLREKKEYEAAFTYLQRAYEKDSKNFGPLGLELLPDTLLKAGRYDEAIAWCDKILNAKSRHRMVRDVIEKKRIEIIAEKNRLGNASQSAAELL